MNINKVINVCDFGFSSSSLAVISFDDFIRKEKQLFQLPHRLNYYQLMIIEKGFGSYFVDGSFIKINERNLVAVSKGQIAGNLFSAGLSGTVLLFSDEFINKYAEDFGWINKLNLLSTTPAVKSMSNPESEQLINLVKYIKSEIEESTSPVNNEMLFHLVKVLLLACERIKNSTGKNTVPETVFDNSIAVFNNQLEENYKVNRSVNFYAAQLSITSKKLNNITLQRFGKTAKKLIEERVLLEIKRLLVYTDYTAKEIGFLTGFNDPTNFTKFFKKFAKVTPAVFRNSLRNDRFNKINGNINHLSAEHNSDNILRE